MKTRQFWIPCKNNYYIYLLNISPPVNIIRIYHTITIINIKIDEIQINGRSQYLF